MGVNLKKIADYLGDFLSVIANCLKKQNSKSDKKNDSSQITINNYLQEQKSKVGRISIINDIDTVYAEETIKELAIKVTDVNGFAAIGIPLEIYIEDVCNSTIVSTDGQGMAYIKNVIFKKAQYYNFSVRYGDGYSFNQRIQVKENKVCLSFLEQPQDIMSQEKAGRVAVQASYKSGKKIKKEFIHISLNMENVNFKGAAEKMTNEEGIAYFENLIFGKTGSYKLKATCKGEYIYSDSFRVFPPGVNSDFENFKGGSEEETEAFLTSLLQKQSQGDIIKYNGEEY